MNEFDHIWYEIIHDRRYIINFQRESDRLFLKKKIFKKSYDIDIKCYDNFIWKILLCISQLYLYINFDDIHYSN